MRTHSIVIPLIFGIVSLSPAGGFEVRSDSRYADSASCRECHEAECVAWDESDHRHAMATPTSENILGDFSTTFVHFGFDDVLSLSDVETQTLVAALWDAPRDNALRDATAFYRETYENYDRAGRKRQPRRDATFDDFALALRDAKTGVAERLVASMTPEQQKSHADEVAFLEQLVCVRAGDIAAAQYRIGRVARRLIAEGKIATPKECRVSRFSRDGADNFVVETDDARGETNRFTITGVIGVRPLQQYLVELPRGRVQVLPLAWDAVCGEWFHLYPKEQINSNDPLHWTRPLQNANSMCADCHTTGLQKRFDVASQTYNTTCVEMTVGCQSCHGPCGEHVTNARARNLQTAWDDTNDLATLRFTRASSTEAIDACAECHSRRRWLTSSPHTNAAPLLDRAIPEILDGTLYYTDGQLREEAFEYTSFLQAKMWAMGVRCTDCHDPHTARLVRSGNRLCTQCHSPQLYDTPQHHFHTDNTKPGTMCVECHMPETNFMVIDSRRDHSIRKPRPDWTVSLGVPNACNSCHHDRSRGETASWAAAKCDEWYRVRRETNVGFTSRSEVAECYPHILAAGRANAVGAANAAGAANDLVLLLAITNDKELRPIVRASAAILLGRQQPPLDVELWKAAMRPLIVSSNPLLRYAATVASESREPLENVWSLAPLLTDSVRGVRCEAARILAPVPKTKFTATDYRALAVVLKEYITAQDIVNDQAAAHLNVAVVLRNSATPSLDDVATWLSATQDECRRAQRPAPEFAAAAETARLATIKLTDPAVARYQTSLKIDPEFIPSRINLAMLHHERGEAREAESQFREVLRIDPTFGDAAYSLGLLLAEQSRWDDAAAALREAAKLMPNHARVYYNLALVLQKIGKHDEAAATIEKLIQLEPNNPQWRKLKW